MTELEKEILKSNGNFRYLTSKYSRFSITVNDDLSLIYDDDNNVYRLIVCGNNIDVSKSELSNQYKKVYSGVRDKYKDIYADIDKVLEYVNKSSLQWSEVKSQKIIYNGYIDTGDFDINKDSISIDVYDDQDDENYSRSKLYLPESIMSQIQEYLENERDSKLSTKREELEIAMNMIEEYDLQWRFYN